MVRQECLTYTKRRHYPQLAYLLLFCTRCYTIRTRCALTAQSPLAAIKCAITLEPMVSLPPLLVFADDWDRHPSSCQHLIRRLRDDRRILWANSIGTRQAKANAITFRRGLEKMQNWSRGLTRVSEQM